MSQPIVVAARDYWNDTGVYVAAGETWRFTATGRWVDWFVPCGPHGYEQVLLRPLEPRRRAPSAKWFGLIGAVNRDETTCFEIGDGCVHAFERAGEISVFANDLPWMYWNNRGTIALTCLRVGAPS